MRFENETFLASREFNACESFCIEEDFCHGWNLIGVTKKIRRFIASASTFEELMLWIDLNVPDIDKHNVEVIDYATQLINAATLHKKVE